MNKPVFLSSEKTVAVFGPEEYATFKYQGGQRLKQKDKIVEDGRIWVIERVHTEQYNDGPVVHTIDCRPLFPRITPWLCPIYFRYYEPEDDYPTDYQDE